MTIKERIDYNIEELRAQIDFYARHFKGLIRECLAAKASQG